MRTAWKRAVAGIGVVALASAAGIGAAVADNIQLTGPSSVTAARNSDVSFVTFLEATSDTPTSSDVNGCNVTGTGNGATISFSSSNTAVAAAPSSVLITACDDPRSTPTIEGSVQVTVHVKSDAPAGASTTITATGTGGKVVGGGNTAQYATDSISITVQAQVAQGALALSPVSPAVFGQTYALTLASPGSGTGAYSYAATAASDACTVPSASVAEVSITKGTGTCAVTVTRAADANYLEKTSAPLTISVSKATQDITFAQPSTPQTYGEEFAVAPTSSAGLAVSLGATGPCSVSGPTAGAYTVTMTAGTGSCELTASQAGSTDYSAATSVARTVGAALRPLTVTADAKAKTYGDGDPALTYATSGSLVGTDAVTGALSRVAGETVGTYAITQGTVSAGPNYDITYHGALLTIGQRVVAVTADPQTKVYGDSDPALTYQVTSGSLASGDAFTGSLSREAGEDVGTHGITQGTLALSDNYDLSFTGANLSVTPRPITVTAQPASKTYGDADPAFGYDLTSGSLAFTDDLTGAMSRSAGEDVGSYALTQGTLTAGSNYELTFASADLTIGQRPVTATADAKFKTYGDADPALTHKITAGSLVGSDHFTGALSRTAGEDVGSYAIDQNTLALSGNYALTFVGADLTISARPITVTADPQTKTYGDGDPTLSYKLTGHLVFDDALTGSLSRVAGENVGKHAITQGTMALSANYALTFVGADLTITVRPVTVTAAPKTKTYGDADPALTYGVTAGSLAFTDAFSGALTRALGEDVGTRAITQGTLRLSDNYDLSFVGADLTITQRPITVTADPKSKILGAGDPALTSQVTVGSLAYSDSLTGALTRDAGEAIGSYPIRQGTLSAGSNYALTFVGANFTIGYGYTQLLAPINVDRSSSFKLGSTIPVKFQLVNASNVVQDAPGQTFTLKVTKTDSVPDYPVNETTVTTASDTGSTFRWDTSGKLYIFNLSTKSLPGEGTYRLDVLKGATLVQYGFVNVKK